MLLTRVLTLALMVMALLSPTFTVLAQQNAQEPSLPNLSSGTKAEPRGLIQDHRLIMLIKAART